MLKAKQGDLTALETIAKNLDVVMDDEPDFAIDFGDLTQEA